MSITPVVMCGGSGSRLWPLSRCAYPKQFQRLDNGHTLLERTVGRLAGDGFESAVVLTTEDQRFLVRNTLDDAGLMPRGIILEPVPRNTGPALAVAALWACEREGDEDAVLSALPADHLIADENAFRASVREAARLARVGHLVAFGVTPSKAHTGYGYIQAGDSLPGGGARVKRFTEKPDAATAERFLKDGGYYWNSGVFVFKARTLLDELQEYAPELLAACREALEGADEDLDFLRLDKAAFENAPSISIDYAVMEHTRRAAVIPVELGWNDIGSWDALWVVGEHDNRQNVSKGPTVSLDVERCYLHSDGPLIAAIGLRDIAIVATDDAVLAMPRDRAEDVKELVDKMKAMRRNEYAEHREVHRPWGSYKQLTLGDRFQVKEIVVRPGASLSLQMHHHRAEHWVVVEGTAEATRGEDTVLISENESIYIPIGARHRLRNPGKVPLRIVEVQSGAYLGEDDIVRFEDDFGRHAQETL